MYELGIRYDKPYRKSARIVGDTMGKYHPHGDSSIYGALVVLAQDFKMGQTLVDGHGNFGSIEGDGAAAMRYTEARLQKLTQEAFLADLDKDVVNFVPNFDETEKEPEVLPVKVPNLLINGAEGIAVGMTTSIPTHNFGEVIDGVIAYMKNPDINTEQMMQYIPGPDFPTGGVIANKDELTAIYSTGVGKIKIRGKVEVEQVKGGKERLVITEIPYTMIGANIGKFSVSYTHLAAKTRDFVTEVDEQSIVLIKDTREMGEDEDLASLASMIVDNMHAEAMVRVRVGYGNRVNNLQDIAKSYQEAKMALEVGKIFYVEKETIAYRYLGIGRLIYQLPMSLCEMFIHEVFGDEIPDVFNEETTTTIQKFFENNLNISCLLYTSFYDDRYRRY